MALPSNAMHAETFEHQPEHTILAAQEALRSGMMELLASRGIDAEAVLAKQRRIAITLDYFLLDATCTVTPAPLASFVAAVYPQRDVEVQALRIEYTGQGNAALQTVDGINKPPSTTLTTSISLWVQPLDVWTVEIERAEDVRGIVLPQRAVVLADYLHLATTNTPMRYALSRFALADWLHFPDGIAADAEEGILDPSVVQSIASLLPDRDIYLRRRGHEEEPDPDLLLPPPKKTITIT